MESGAAELTAVMQRLEQLEKQNRRFKQVGTAILLFLGCTFLMGQTTPYRTIEANEFVLKDTQGKMRGKLAMTDGTAPELILYDSGGIDRVRLGANPFLGSMLSFYSAEKKSGPLRDGLKIDINEAGVAIFDDAGFEARIGGIDLVTPRTGETSKTSAASVVLFDKDKKVLWKAP